MASLRLSVKVDYGRLRSMEGSLEWAVASGLLTEDEAVNAAADDIIEHIVITETLGGKD